MDKAIEQLRSANLAEDRQKLADEVKHWKRTSEWLAKDVEYLNGRWDVAEKLCGVYFDIAAEIIGEEEVKKRRDERIAALNEENNNE